MNSPSGQLASKLGVWTMAFCLVVALSGCMGSPDLGENAPVAATVSPERAAAIADMRAQAEAGDSMPYPDVFQAEQTARLTARAEPLPVADVQAIEAELVLIAEQRSRATDPSEIAALDERARQLRKLALARGAGDLR